VVHSPTTPKPSTHSPGVQRAIHRAWQRLAYPGALGWPVAALYLPFGLAGPLLIDPERLGGPLIQWLIIGLAGQMALFLTLIAARHFAGGQKRLHPAVTVTMLAVAAVIRGLTLATVSFGFGVAPTWEVGYRIVAALGPQTGVLILIAIIVSNQAQNGVTTRELWQARAMLEQASERAQERLKRRQMNIAVTVRGLITPLMQVLDATSERARPDQVEVQDSIRRIIDEGLRPLSHRLAESNTDANDSLFAAQDMVRGTSTRPKSVAMGILLRPSVAAMFAFVLTLSQAIRGLPWHDAVGFPLLFASIVGLVLWLIRRLLLWSPPVWAGIPLAAVLTSVAFVTALNLVILMGVITPPLLNGPAVATGLYVGVLLAVNAALDEQQRRVQAELRQSLDELEIHVSVLRQQDFLARKQLSYIIHGSVQSALHAAALRLASSPAPSAELLSSVRDDIHGALNRLEPVETPYVQLVRSLDDITELWDGTAAVHWTLNHRTVRQLVQAPSTAAAVAEVVTESVSNAIRHGQAKEVWITIETQGEHIQLRILDNGVGLDPTATAGLGSHMFDELCLIWRRESDELGTVVTADIAIPTSAQVTLKG
jgi:signal transduction histidine kinase